MTQELKTSQEWSELYPDFQIMDPDGWDRKNFEESWAEEITEEEFQLRLSVSTVIIKNNLPPNWPLGS